MAKSKDSYIQFFPNDWMSDTELRLLPIEARGLWIDLLCIMHQSESGYRLEYFADGLAKPIDAKRLSLLANTSEEICEVLLRQILSASVASKDDDGFIFSRRLKRDRDLRKVRSEAGRKGAKVTNKGGAEKKKKAVEFSKDVEEIFGLLIETFQEININNPNIPNTPTKVIDAKHVIRLMIERDKKTPEQLKQAVRFMGQDIQPVKRGEDWPGWGKVIRSFASFRKKFDKMWPNVQRYVDKRKSYIDETGNDFADEDLPF